MTFDKAAWAINGPEIGAALARRAQYAASRQSGIVQKGDLKVRQLSTPGIGIIIDAGVGVVLNGYQNSQPGGPNEAYVVNNPGAHTIPADQMPASNPSAKSYLVAIVVGDDDFSQSGHPWMPSTGVPAGEEATFTYVRPTLIPVADSSVTTVSGNYPALVLARLDVPPNTTTITDDHLTDLRVLANPRQEQQIFVSPSSQFSTAAAIPSGSAYANWSSYAPSVKVPSWAKRAIIVASINGVRLADASVNIQGGIRAKIGTQTGPATSFDLPAGRVGAQRENFQAAGSFTDVSTIAGTTQALRIEGFENVPASPTTNQRLNLTSGSQVIFDVRFFEE